MDQRDELQLDRAEFADPSSVCTMCATPLRGHYYEANGSMVCTTCTDTLRVSTEHGSRASRVGRALAAGAAAAFAGALLYWAIIALTGYEFGLIAVVVGVGVGKAVSWGSRGKGGWRYQTLAMGLTYLAMVSAYAPMLFTQLAKATAETQAAGATDGGSAPVAGATTADAAPPSVSEAALGLLMLVGILCALPFLGGIENILGILILGFGLYEAWKLNRRVSVVITGPHALAPVQPA